MKNSFIKNLITLLESSDLDSIQISSFWGMSKIKLFKSSSNQTSQSIINSKTEKKDVSYSSDAIKEESLDSPEKVKPQEENISIENKDDSLNTTDSHEITAPLVGTFYISPKAGDPPFIKIGDKIEVGQTLCIIEAMKIFNEIESEVTGIIEDILVEDTTPIEYGQKIISIKLDD